MLKDYGFPGAGILLQRKVDELAEPHPATLGIGGHRPDSPSALHLPLDDNGLWLEPFPCQQHSRSLNSQPTHRLIEDLIIVISAWYEDAEIFRHFNCDYKSCPFYRSYVEMILWTGCTVSCLRTKGERITAAGYVDQVLTESGVPPIFEIDDPVLQAARKSADHVEQFRFLIQ
jgi:hypothetical protein